jgi:hypothetical protein
MLDLTWQEWKDDQNRKPAIWFMHQRVGVGPATRVCKECLYYRWRRIAAAGGGYFGETKCEQAGSDVHWCGFWPACRLFEADQVRNAINDPG